MRAKTPDSNEAINIWPFVRIDKPHISNSYLSTLKRALIGEPQFYGSEHYLTFGTEHHVRALEPKQPITLLEKNDELCTGMAYSFRNSPEVKPVLRGAQTEVEYSRVYRGALVLLFLDIFKPLRGWDLKGTSCETWTEFLKKSREYDYFRQAALYMAVCNLREFSFIGQRKKPVEVEKGYPGSYEAVSPDLRIVYYYHPLFFLNVLDYPTFLEEGRRELHYLIDTHLILKEHKLKLAA